jgi:hypothetical protein
MKYEVEGRKVERERERESKIYTRIYCLVNSFGGMWGAEMLLTVFDEYGDVTELVVVRRSAFIILFICGLGYLKTVVSSSDYTKANVRMTDE